MEFILAKHNVPKKGTWILKKEDSKYSLFKRKQTILCYLYYNSTITKFHHTSLGNINSKKRLYRSQLRKLTKDCGDFSMKENNLGVC